ncbi:MAG: 4Fe-4S dicluster domain-containing protein [Bacillota bacterium]
MAQSKRYRVQFNTKWCKACGICVVFCPKKVFDKAEDGKPVVARAEDCIGCKLCELRCPDYALFVEADEQ